MANRFGSVRWHTYGYLEQQGMVCLSVSPPDDHGNDTHTGPPRHGGLIGYLNIRVNKETLYFKHSC